tara:strand:- start:1880 stop:3346 length:1467 start_codon:yes stop_codon:yes gene_type:complete
MKKEYLILLLIFLVSLGFQLFFSLQVPYYSSDDAYFELRHSEYIEENYKPLIYDEMSYEGNYILNTHVWHYFLAFLGLLLPSVLVYKIIPAFLASFVVFFVFIIARHLTKNTKAALFGALISAFIPTYIALTLNQISLYSIYVPLTLLLIYTFFNIKKRISLFIFLSFLVVLLDPMNFLVLLALLIFLILVVAESIIVRKEITESVIFFFLLTILINLILFKNLYMESALGALWQNVPTELYANYFKDFDVLGLIYNIGFLPIVLGFIGLGLALSKEKKKEIYFLSAVILSDIGLLMLRLIPYEVGVMFLAILLCIASTITIKEIIEYFKLTKIVKYSTWVIVVIMFITVVSLMIPSVINAKDVIDNGVSSEEVDALTWISENSPESSVILGNVFEGNMILELAERANVIDTQFLLAPDRYYDIDLIYTTESLYKAGVELSKYEVDYIYFSEKTQEMFGITEITYVSDETCFEKVYENEKAKVYEKIC